MSNNPPRHNSPQDQGSRQTQQTPTASRQVRPGQNRSFSSPSNFSHNSALAGRNHANNTTPSRPSPLSIMTLPGTDYINFGFDTDMADKQPVQQQQDRLSTSPQRRNLDFFTSPTNARKVRSFMNAAPPAIVATPHSHLQPTSCPTSMPLQSFAGPSSRSPTRYAPYSRRPATTGPSPPPTVTPAAQPSSPHGRSPPSPRRFLFPPTEQEQPPPQPETHSSPPRYLVCNLCILPFMPSAETIRPDVQGRAYCSYCIGVVANRIVKEQKERVYGVAEDETERSGEVEEGGEGVGAGEQESTRGNAQDVDEHGEMANVDKAKGKAVEPEDEVGGVGDMDWAFDFQGYGSGAGVD